jgi:hypothetical protein
MSCTYQAHYDFPTLYEGDTFEARDITIQEDNGSALSSARLVFERNGTATKTLTSASGLTLTSTAAGNWIITINAWAVDIAVGTHFWDLETTDANGVVKHYLGGVFRVIETAS